MDRQARTGIHCQLRVERWHLGAITTVMVWGSSKDDRKQNTLAPVALPLPSQDRRVQIQKKVISDLKSENHLVSKEIWESVND
jgi:hypothetical protein